MRIILYCLITLIAAPAWAKWVKVEVDNEYRGTTHYILPETIQKFGDVRRVWGLQDLKVPGSNGERSMRFLSEYDCKEDRTRVLLVSEHTLPMTEGSTIQSVNAPTGWCHVPPGTASESVLKKVCSN